MLSLSEELESPNRARQILPRVAKSSVAGWELRAVSSPGVVLQPLGHAKEQSRECSWRLSWH